MHRVFHVIGWSYVAVCAAFVVSAPRARRAAAPRAPLGTAPPRRPAPAAAAGGTSDAAVWFRQVKPYCNSVEVGVLQRHNPAPATTEGQGYRAACHALAGQIDEARRIIDALPDEQRPRAAGIVFDVGHPVADAGDDRSAGPIMELVVDYWPDHFMALYHAGMAEYMLGQHALAKRNLEAFLRIYKVTDGWRANAVEVLARLGDPAGRGARDLRRPREPGR
jgi:hypothetical protein